MSDELTEADGRKVIAAILTRKLHWNYGSDSLYTDRESTRRIDVDMFATDVQRDIASVALAGAEVDGLHLLHHGNLLAIAGRMVAGEAACRAELNRIDPFRWPLGNGKLGREVKA